MANERRRIIETSRLEAFSDGVMAVIITIMVLELRAPVSDSLYALKPLIPHFLVYALAFQVIGTYWNNHHHMLRATKHITGSVMWLNLHLLFWLSLIPFFTSWLGENHGARVPTAFFAGVLLAAAVAYFFLQRAIVAVQPKDAKIASAIGEDYKGKLSMLAYLLAIPLAFVSPWISDVLIVGVTLVWFIPDRRLSD